MAEVATGSSYKVNVEKETEVMEEEADTSISSILEESLVLPHVETSKRKRKLVLDDLPDNLTSGECLRAMALKELERVKIFAAKEKGKRKISVQGIFLQII